MRTILISLLLLAGAKAAQGQWPAFPAADSALAACLASRTVAAGETAERLWRDAVAREPGSAAARTGLAQVLVRCRMANAAGPADQMGLFQEGVSLLRGALEREPRYWRSRLVLGLVYAGAPEFLGQAPAGIEQLELAIGPDGIPPSEPAFAEALTALAGLYDRTGRTADAAAIRARLSTRSESHPTIRPSDDPTTMSAITITSASSAPAVANREGRAVTALDVVTMPGGAADLMQALQVLPGVTGGSESSELSLRGGDPYEAPVLLDGARLAFAGTFESLSGSLFGVIDPDVISSVQVHPGAFSARHGDALSGIISAETVSRPAARSRRYGLSTAGPAATLMQPVGARGGAWASARLTNTALMLRMHGRQHEYAGSPLAAQGIAGATRRIGAGEVKGVVVMQYDDASPMVNVAGHDGAWHSTGATAAALVSARTGRAGPFSHIRLTGSASQRRSDTEFGVLDFERGLRRAGLRAEGDAVVAGVALVTAGVELAHLRETIDGTVPTDGELAPGSATRDLDVPARGARHAGAFVETVFAPASWLTLRTGLRADRLPGEGSTTLDPRVGLEAVFGAWAVSLGGGVFHQGRFRPTSERPGQDLRTGVATRAEHLMIGLERRGAVTVRADAYLKRYGRFAGGDSAFAAVSGTTMGGDLFINVPGYRRSGHATWSVMRGRLELPGGERISTSHDVTHSLVAVGAQRLGASWDVGVTLRLATGRPYTASINSDSAGPVLGAPNAERYPMYRRVDARVTRYVRRGTRLVVLFAELLNLEGRGNVVGYGVQTAGGRSEPITTFYGKRTAILGVELR